MIRSDSTITLVQLALDAALMRQTAIAHNIANNSTKNYQPIAVNFEQQLDATPHLEQAKPFYEPTEATTIEEQLSLSVQNMTQYRALIKGLNHKLSLMKLALQGINS